VDAETLAGAGEIIEAVRAGGEAALRRYGERFDGLASGGALVLERADLARALESMDAPDRALLERTSARIRVFAEAQRAALAEIDIAVPGGRAGHSVLPMARAGCYAPGGRYPLPSSVLMTAVTARAAGCGTVVVATPSREPVMLAAAAIAGADLVLNCGGAHAIAALAYGIPGMLEPVDVVVGPGNRWVTAAKKLVTGTVAIDMLAGPSELVVLADESADAATVAADLLAQAEHDDDAVPILVTTSGALIDRVNAELCAQLESLPTAPTARHALRNGFACVCDTLDEAIDATNRIAPEHLEIQTRDPSAVGARITNAGALFLGAHSAEVFGDYGLGPNHTLPTGATARHGGGLSVFDFLRVRTWLRMDGGAADHSVIDDVAALARIERLEGHARSGERRTRS
jgi:phosphoribosyl-ATP pyrophosphohydrolase/phosphoribosyl-AMP cyclohydrolase/histidinol dehydrogenase